MSFLEGIKRFGKKTYKFLRGNSTASTLVKVAALAFLVNKLNRNKNRDNDQDTKNIDQGVRVQVPPASDNKVPVLYGTAFFGGAITDAQMTNSNKTMTFCVTLSETTGPLRDSSASTYNFKDVYWNDQRIVFKSDGFTADYTVDRNGNFDRSIEGLVKVYCYAGGTSNPVVPDNYTNSSYPNAYDVMPNWSVGTHLMTNLVFAVIEVNYSREKGITSLVDMKFEIANSMKLPGDVLSDYMQSTIYGAGIDATKIDSSLDTLNTFSAQSVNYDDQGTGTETLADRYQINGLLDTAQPVMQNIEKITSTAGSFLKYDIHEGKFGVTINQAGSSTASFTDDNILGNVDLSGTGLKELYNKVKVEFPHRDLKDSADFVTIEISASDRNSNEEDNTLQLTYDILNEPVQAQLLGLIELKQSRVNAVIQFTTDYSYINLKAGDLIDVTNSRLGYTSKVFRIITIQEQQDQAGALQMRITALEYDADVYSTTNLSRFTRTDSTGIITIGSIGTPGTPQVTKFERDARPRINVESTAPTGIVEAMEFWRSTDVSLSEASRSYQLIATVKPANGGNFTSGTTVTLDYDALTNSDFVLKTRGINSTTSGPFSAVSGLVDFTPKQETDSIGPNTELTDSTGNLLGALALIDVLLKLHDLFGSTDGNKSIFERIFEIFTTETGKDIVQETKDGTFGGSTIVVQDEGTQVASAGTTLNFVGDSVTASATGGVVTVNVSFLNLDPAPTQGQIIVFDETRGFVAADPPNAVTIPSAPTTPATPTFIEFVQFYPSDRNTFRDPVTGVGYDEAPTTGSYFAKYGTGDSTVFYGALTIGSGNIKLYKSDGTLVETLTASQLTVDNNVVEYPFATRANGTDFYIIQDQGVIQYCDDVSRAIDSPLTWNFNTPNYSVTALNISGDTPPANPNPAPVAESVSPGGTNVCPNADLVIDFDQPVKVGTGNIEIKLVSDNSTVVTINAANGTLVSGTTDQINYGPVTGVTAGVQHYVTAPAGIAKYAGDCYSDTNSQQIQQSDNFTFTPNSDLVVTSFTVNSLPITNDTTKQKANIQTNIEITFNRAIVFGTAGTFTLKAGSSTVQTFDVTTNYTDDQTSEIIFLKTGVTDTVVLNPTTDLALGTDHHVLITAGAVVDSCPTDCQAVTSTSTIAFKTYDGPTSVVSITNGSPNDTGVKLTFDNDVVPSTGKLRVIDTTTNTEIATIDSDDSAVSIT